MIVQCISFGSHWWLRKVYDERTGELLRYRSAFMNTTRVKVAEHTKSSSIGFLDLFG